MRMEWLEPYGRSDGPTGPKEAAMITSRLRCAGFLAVVAALGAGCSSDTSDSTATTAAAKAPTTAAPSDTASSGAAVASGGEVTLVVRFSEARGPETIDVTFGGAIDDAGSATQTFNDSGDGGSGTIEFTLGQGTLTASFVEHDFQLNMDAAACTASPTSSGTITIDGGTGAYAGAAGTLDFTVAGTVVGEKDASGTCLSDTAPPLSSTTDLSGTGRIDFAG